MRFLFILFIILLTPVLASCSTQQIIHTSNKEFLEGTDGLDFLFVDENPPEVVYEDTPFTVVLDLKNTGAHTLTGFLTLSLEDDYVCLVDENNECSIFNPIGQTAQENIEQLKDSVAVMNPYKTKWFSLEGRSIFNYQGGIMVLSYPAKAKSAGTMSEKHNVQFVATACYEYTTKWTQEVCIDTDINKMNIFPGACEATEISLSGQGAPLAITSIESTMLPTGKGYIRPMFTIYIENSGNGKIINKNKKEEACTATGLTSRDYNMVFLKSVILSGEELSYDFNGYDPATGKELNPNSDNDLIQCSPNPLILKNDGNDYIRCIVAEDLEWDMFSMNQASYTTLLSLQFDYGYTLSKSKEMIIKKIY